MPFLLLSEDGRIPPKTECPFYLLCSNPGCHHQGKEHATKFSCATARAFDLIIRGMLENHGVTYYKECKDDPPY